MVGPRHLGQPLLYGRRLVRRQGFDRADPNHLLGIAGELDQPDNRIDVATVFEEGDDGDSLLGLGAEDQAAEADLLLRQAAGLEEIEAVSRTVGSSSWSRLRSMSSVDGGWLHRAKEIRVCFRTSEFLFST